MRISTLECSYVGGVSKCWHRLCLCVWCHESKARRFTLRLIFVGRDCELRSCVCMRVCPAHVPLLCHLSKLGEISAATVTAPLWTQMATLTRATHTLADTHLSHLARCIHAHNHKASVLCLIVLDVAGRSGTYTPLFHLSVLVCLNEHLQTHTDFVLLLTLF